MSDKMVKIAKEAIKNNGDLIKTECGDLFCTECIFGYMINGISCTKAKRETVIKIAEEYLESALSIDVPSIEMVEKENEDVKVERKMSLKEKILAKIDYKKIAEEIYEILEDDIVEEVASSFDEMEIAYDLIDGYRSDFIETAREVIVENIEQEINVDDVSDYLKEVAIDNID